MITKITTIALGFIGLGLIANSFADDTELYVLESSVRSGDNPQVLIILDTSGSMGGGDGLGDMETYPFLASEAPTNTTKLYYSLSADDVPEAGSQQYFLYQDNRCQSSAQFIEDFGVYSGYFREYQSSTWQELPVNDGSNINVVDCFEDISIADSGNNGAAIGFPVDGLANSYSNDANALENAKLTNFGLGQPITVFTDRYVNWFHNKPAKQTTKRMDVAKRVLNEVIVNTPGVDLGLMIFNKNTNNEDRHGGRVISKIEPGNITNKKSLVTKVNNTISIDGNSTPLCETLYEAALYLHGKDVDNGHKTSGSTANPTYDTGAESPPGTYLSPFIDKECGSNASIIYITDGAPQRDKNENDKIKTLLGYSTATEDKDVTGSVKVTAYSWDEHYSLMPPLAGWLANNDVNPYSEGTQIVTTHTIGFSEGVGNATVLLEAVADYGKGDYYYAENSAQLQASLIKAIEAIKADSSSFTSPSVVLDKTQTGDAAYFAMFLPGEGPRWSGNLKKFKVSGTGDVLDNNDNFAFDDNGSIKVDACSLWSASDCANSDYEGYDVNDGGVLSILRDEYNTDAKLANRKVLVNTGTTGELVDLTVTNAKKLGSLSNEELALHLKVDIDTIESTIDWARGANVDSELYDMNTAPFLRQDIIGDPLHSRPLVIDYGSLGTRILMGTNHGFLHMFKDEIGESSTSVSESWAFIPHELLPNIKGLRDNPKTGVHSIYGLDGSPVVHIERSDSGNVTKAWVFIGMRRGGSSYYALDITSPDSPTLMWIKNDNDYPDWGQSWSDPVITKVPDWPSGATSSADADPVLIVGAGYNPNTKDGSSVGGNDVIGTGVYILDAKTGVKVHSFGRSGSDTSMPSISDSIPNKVAILDSNNDQLTDRIYATDTGANVWRMDLPGLSTDSSNPWSAFKFANLGGGTTTTDIRFFSEPVVAQTTFSNVAEHTHTEGGTTTTTMTYQSIPYDAVVIGSGHRPHPLDKQRADKFFTLQDRNIVTKSYSSAAGNTAPDTLDNTDLYNVTSESPASDSELVTFGAKRGWYYNFSDAGEKSLSAATIVSGRVFFTSYVPETGASENACLVPGQGRLYGFDLHKGARTYNHTEDYFVMGEQVPDTPTLVVPKNGDSDSYMYLIGIGDAANEMIKNDVLGDDGCAEGDDKCIGGGLGVNRIYYHQNEN
ncbi:rRNA (guanine-N1)-methyltransferase [Shewanella sp. 10N.7]|uniref:pilus assembly protein n=1 Tax=Shewanella sp. 10N.7 TaxID=2885093 RepID=UPI001E4481F2|nr:PilC/PilY family type IV pilus protein [Shewanella sp. 10N.7]MCC4831164.1 rRNA (guanine-N1)-methyltransferase [Shewanella sp. 10N.7]